jgi:tetratricopeptide (TPR) repeat protein
MHGFFKDCRTRSEIKLIIKGPGGLVILFSRTAKRCYGGFAFCFVSAFILFLSNSALAQNTYNDFLEARKFYDSGNVLLGQQHYRKALRLFQKATDDPDQKLSAHNGAAICYMKLGDEEKALMEIEEAFRHGYLLRYLLQDRPLQPIRQKMEQRFKILRPQYLATIDTVLREEIQRMVENDQTIRYTLQQADGEEKDSLSREMRKIDSLNISRLKAIEQKYGWPGFTLIGNRQTYPTDVDADVALLVTHASEGENHYFLDAALEKIQKKEASWWDAYGIMKNLVFRFNEDGHNKLRHIGMHEQGNVDMERSFFQLKVLADFLKDNPLQKITLFVVQYEDENSQNLVQYQKSAKEVRDFLVKEGIPVKSVGIREKMKIVKDDKLGRYRIGYERE